MPLYYKNETAVYIPQTNTVYWNLLSYKKVQFIVPALTGMAMVDGIQPFIPEVIDDNEMEYIIHEIASDQREAISQSYDRIEPVDSMENTKYILNKDLDSNGRLRIYNLLAPLNYDLLENYGYRSYIFPSSEEEYLAITNNDQTLCKTGSEKGFRRILIISVDDQDVPASREIICK